MRIVYIVHVFCLVVHYCIDAKRVGRSHTPIYKALPRFVITPELHYVHLKQIVKEMSQHCPLAHYHLCVPLPDSSMMEMSQKKMHK